MMLLQIIGKPWFNFIVLCIEKLLVLVEHSHRKCINLILVHMRWIRMRSQVPIPSARNLNKAHYNVWVMVVRPIVPRVIPRC